MTRWSAARERRCAMARPQIAHLTALAPRHPDLIFTRADALVDLPPLRSADRHRQARRRDVAHVTWQLPRAPSRRAVD